MNTKGKKDHRGLIWEKNVKKRERIGKKGKATDYKQGAKEKRVDRNNRVSPQ